MAKRQAKERTLPIVEQLAARDVRNDLTHHGLYPILIGAMPTIVDGDFEWDSAKAASNHIAA